MTHHMSDHFEPEDEARSLATLQSDEHQQGIALFHAVKRQIVQQCENVPEVRRAE